MRAALLQITSSDAPAENLETVRIAMQAAAADGAGFVLTPEVTNCVSSSRSHQQAVLTSEDSDPVLAGLRDEAARLGVWLLIGSLAVKSDPPETRFANRSFMIGPDGGIVARYDKLHMFDVQVTETETYRESEGFAPGDRAVIAPTGFGAVGMTICYDVRFPYLHRALAQAGAEILTVPAAFSPATGPGHWEPLLRARAIETGCYVLAPGQVGQHTVRHGKPRATHGHSLAISPWGAVLADAGDRPGIVYADLDLAQVRKARAQIPALQHDRSFTGPA
ncbi:carbon-nitrogen hydrolase family protein [Salipiger sp. P9]|uniref:carbon-nitrogen hydrolase family protein n=1 Tax=Salipiger pentaromativorans TaxID=2943193 RepID=UPI0021579481|nr:carbon-nitrogen hydrolase family protein [Salipiger pentaromativorans]MCR8549581.1 carbon-nitrogen hydrolase family protein [Salipiger pentaromativorans]